MLDASRVVSVNQRRWGTGLYILRSVRKILLALLVGLVTRRLVRRGLQRKRNAYTGSGSRSVVSGRYGVGLSVAPSTYQRRLRISTG